VHQHLLYCKFVLRFLVGLCWAILGLAVAPVQAQTYAYRNDVFAYDTPSGTASSVTWHASGASPGCTGYPNGDDDWADVALPGGFTFTFGGVAYSSVRVYSNGILAYGADVSGFHRDYTSQALPIIAAAGGAPAGCPNAVPQRLMLPYWLDIVAGTANSTAGASVQYELLGTAPNRRFVISWVNVKLYNTATRYNFQVQLLESTAGVNGNFRYQYTTGSSTGSGATVGVQLTTTDFTQYAFNQNFIDTTVGTAVLWYPANQLAAKGAEYRFDESAWTGVAGEIKDTSGNIQHASRVGLAASVAPPPAFPGGKLCRGGSFPLNTLNTTIGAVATPITPGNQGSIDFWFNSNVAWNAGGSVAMLLDATTVANRPFFLMKSAAGALTFRLTDSAGTSVTATAPVRTFAANTWHHVGIAWNVRVGTNQTVLQIFLDGALQNGVPTRGTTNGIMPGLSSFHVGDNRTSGITPTGGTPNSANGSIDEVYIYGVEISAPQALADMNLTRPVCTSLDHFHIIHDGTTSGCTASANITIEAHDSTHALFTLAGTSMNLSTTPARGTWSNVPGGAINSLTAIVAGGGTASYSFANENRVIFGLSDNQTGSLNINVASGAITELSNAGASCVVSDYTTGTTCDASRNFLCLAFGFNCVESGAAALTGDLFTKLAGTPFAFNVVALKDADNNGTADGVETSYASDANKSVTVELVDGSGATACASRSVLSPAVTQTLVFTKLNQPMELGTKSTANMTVTKAYPDLRCRVTDASQTPSLVACSTDNFSVRPSAVTLVTAASAAAPSSTATPTVKAGVNFSLQATTSTGTNYAGTLTLDTAVAPPAAVKMTAQTTSQDTSQASGGVVGTLSPATLVGNAAAINATYSEVGYLYLAPGAYRDDTYTAVDSGTGDCIVGSYADTLPALPAAQQYGCSVANKSSVALGRFIPDHFDTTATGTLACAATAGTVAVTLGSTAVTGTGTAFLSAIAPGNTVQIGGGEYLVAAVPGATSLTLATPYTGATASGMAVVSCPTGAMVYSGQAFGALVNARNLAGTTTQNYNGKFSKTVTLSAAASRGGAAIAATAPGGTLTGSALDTSFTNGSNAASLAAPVFAFATAPTLPTGVFVRATDPDGVVSLRSPATASVEGGVKVVSGRIRIPNAYGSERLALPMTATVQYYNAAANWVTSLTDNVTTFNTNLSTAGGNLVATVIQGPITGVTVTSPGSGAVTAGVRPFSLAAPLVGGSVALQLNAPLYLPNANARATFGAFRSPLIYRRENY
jgi:MSHA biogenesis protein MshQ